MFNYIKIVGLLVLCLILGVIGLALTPIIITLGVGLFILFLGYVIYLAHGMDIDAEVDKLKEKRRSK